MAKKTVSINVDLGELKPKVAKTARAWGVSVDEFVRDALQYQIQSNQPRSENFTPHGGQHRMGKTTGYEVTKDGRYYPAPTWTEHFDNLFAEKVAIYNLA